MHHRSCAGIVLCGLLACASTARGALIYSQPLYSPSTSQFGYNSNLGDQQIADSFDLSGAAVVDSVEWFGIYHNGSIPAVPRTFSIVFYEDNAGQVSATEVSAQLVSTLGVATGLSNLTGLPIMRYLATLPTSVSLSSDPHWVMIREDDPATSSTWTWQFSNTGDNVIAAGHVDNAPGEWYLFEGSDMAFSLHSEAQITVVPEPGSIALLLCAAPCAAIYMNRRRRSVKP